MRIWGATHKNTFFGIVNFIHTHTRYCCWHVWCTGMCLWGATPKTHIFWHCAFQTHLYRPSKTTVGGILGAEVCVFGAPHQKHTFWHCEFHTYPYPSKNTAGGTFGVQARAFGAPPHKHTLFGIVHFKHTHTRHPKTRLLAYLVQRYARLGSQAIRANYLALCISYRPILDMQKHCYLVQR